MDTSYRMLAALDRITSSIVSTANSSFGRVLSFTGSFNDRTSLLVAAAPGPAQELTTAHPSSSQAQEAAPALTTVATLDIEAVAPSTILSGDGGGGHGQEPTAAAQGAESKRVAKSVQTVCLFAASASLVLFVNLPTSMPGADAAAAWEHAGTVLYSVDLAFICLGLFTSLILSMFSIVARSSGGDPAVARVQKRAMVMAVAFVLVSFTLRMCMMLPAASLEYAWLFFVLLAGAVAVYLSLAWKFGGGRRAEASNGSDSAGTADRV